MSLSWLIYFYNLYENFTELYGVAFLIQLASFCIFLFVLGCDLFASDGENIMPFIRENIKNKFFKWWMWIFAILLTLSLFMPDPKSLAAMYVLPKIVENPQISALAPSAVAAAQKYLDDYLQSQIKGEK